MGTKKNQTKGILEKILKYMNVKAKLTEMNEDNTCKISIESKDTSLLIGYHGENLSALQHIVNLLATKEEYVLLDVSDYRKEKEEKIKKLALDVASKVKRGKKFEVLRPMTGYERRLVHLTLSKDTEVITESVGIEPNRRVVIKFKSN